MIQNLYSLAGHTYLIRVRKTEAESQFDPLLIFIDRSDLTAYIASRFLYSVQDSVEKKIVQLRPLSQYGLQK